MREKEIEKERENVFETYGKNPGKNVSYIII